MADPALGRDLLVAASAPRRGLGGDAPRDAGLAGAHDVSSAFAADVAPVIAAADVLVHPARYEAYGLGVHEALCRGLPAIVSAPPASPSGCRMTCARLLLARTVEAAAELTRAPAGAGADAMGSRFEPRGGVGCDQRAYLGRHGGGHRRDG